MIRAAVLLGAGLISALRGLAIRSCEMTGDSLASAWCGGVPQSVLATQTVDHCAGCALLAAGVCMIAGALGLSLRAARLPVIPSGATH